MYHPVLRWVVYNQLWSVGLKAEAQGWEAHVPFPYHHPEL